MHDLVIRGGLVVDGSGAPARHADIAIDGDRITALGPRLARGAREIDASDLLITPGVVDIHTHYDGQVTWDAWLSPSSSHGVTTAVFGNCGVGFAPLRPGSAPYLINLMEGVEDIPGSVLAEGVAFDWESFPDYLAALERAPKVMDVGAQVPHAALRFYVMGERGAEHTCAPSVDEITRMGELLAEALDAGALGFTTSRTIKHRARDGRATPSLSAAYAELAGLADAMRRVGRGVIEVNSDFAPGEFALLDAIAARAGRPLSVLLLQVNHAPELWRETLAQIGAARAAGRAVNGQVGTRPIGVMWGFETTLNPFITHPAWRALADLPAPARAARVASDAELRRRLIEQRPDDEYTRQVADQLAMAYVLDDDYDYEPNPADSLAARAARRGVSAWQAALEAMLEADGERLIAHTFENYAGGSLDVIREMLASEATIVGLGDGGAHVCTLCDAGAPTFLLTHWARDRTRGPRLPLEYLVHKQTRATALTYGLRDRGLLAPGLRADLNIIDFARLRVTPPRVVYDLPAGGKRLVQGARGYRHTFVAGVETLCDDRPTGALPGRLLRSAVT